jgi:hypothetical protein
MSIPLISTRFLSTIVKYLAGERLGRLDLVMSGKSRSMGAMRCIEIKYWTIPSTNDCFDRPLKVLHINRLRELQHILCID